ncbi:alpha-L-fucosidase [Jiangella gansuensis]|uniref:alpha-L-fucosidase n=1 Tax=Jiangella gansuensis TaxID=281473 RepID=UPI0004B7849C|nr:alpha-L-fucosidase [Jiangella gansuensis]
MITRRAVPVGAGVLVIAGALGAAAAEPTPAPTGAPATAPVGDYEPTVESLSRHETPEWFTDAKLGIFIHWGPYSVPAYAPPGGGARPGSDVYAEWYWYEMNQPGSPTHQHHAETYGEDVPYDAFVEQWNPVRFDPEQWLDLFADAGAEYFVLVSKHHDGVALWDSDTTDRDTVAMGPRRDLVADLFEAADDRSMRTGLYYSLAEWYHPAGGWDPPRGHSLEEGPVNPYTGDPVPYTGYVPVSDDVLDHQYPQMLELVDRFDPDIIWCDIGPHVPHNSNEFMAFYYNQAKNRPQPKDVAVNDRCGNDVHDFVTREYRNQPAIDPNPWEATRGLGRSFGYNAEEGPEVYLSADQLIDSFVDTVSKNGNLLLNIGPMADGSIPDIQADRVRALGAWLDVNGEAIRGATYWTRADDAHSNVPVRYTVNDGVLYATALQWPGEELVLSGEVPLAAGSTITLLGSGGEPLPWRRDGRQVTVTMPAAGAAATTSEHAYTFEISTPGLTDVRDVVRTSLDVPDSAEPGESFVATATVTNPGDRHSASVRVELGVPAGWSVAPRRDVLGPMAPDESATAEFVVTPPAGTATDQYQLTVVTSAAHVGQVTGAPVVVGFESAVDVVAPAKLSPGVMAVEGAEYYVDRDVTLRSLPAELRGATMIRGANDDKRLTDPEYLVVDARRDLDLYVALDPRGAPENGGWWPAWLEELGFRPTGEEIASAGDDAQPALRLFKLERPVAAGERIVLGGNGATTGSSGTYVTFAVPR